MRSGQVLVWATPDRSTPWVSSFLAQVPKWVPRGPIVLITDSISTRTGKTAAKWLSRHPRVEFARYCSERLARPFEWTYTGKVLAA